MKTASTLLLVSVLAATQLLVPAVSGGITPRQECRTEYETVTSYEEQCTTSSEKQCTISHELECSTSYQKQCVTTYEQECSTIKEVLCTSSYEDECSTTYGEERCRQVPKSNCHKVPREICKRVPKESCNQVPKQTCHQVPKTHCKDVPRQSCTRIPVHKKEAKEVCSNKRQHGAEVIVSRLIQPEAISAALPKIASLSPSTDSPDWQTFLQQVLGTPLAAARSSSLDAKSPSAKAALSYLQGALNLDNCGQLAKIYLETILSGGSVTQANAKATAVYIRNYSAGKRAAPGSPCEASDIAFRQAAAAGQDPVLAAALAFMKSYESDSPCFASARDYVESIVAGSSQTEANIKAARAFAQQLKTLVNQGKPTIDEACAASAQAFASSSDTPSPNAAAMQAFISKALETGNGFDPVCYRSAERFFESFEAGKTELESTFAAARDFLEGYKNSPTPASRSPCAAATKAYAAASRKSPSVPSQKALLAFVDEAVFTDDDGLDPVCGASAEAYFDTYLTGAGEAAASEAAAVAYLEAVGSNADFDTEGPCGRAAAAYIAAF